MKLSMKFIALEDVIHPLTRVTLVAEGAVYTPEEFDQIARDTGMDNIKCQVVLGYPEFIDRAVRAILKDLDYLV